MKRIRAARGDLIVTGTRILRPNLQAANPVSVVSGQQFFETGRTNVGEVLNELPQLRNTYNQQNSTRFLGTRGLNLLEPARAWLTAHAGAGQWPAPRRG